MGTPILADRSRAAVSAPRRAERKIGFVELFAIIAMRMGFASGRAASDTEAVGTGAGGGCRHPAANRTASVAVRAPRRSLTLPVPRGEPACREAGARLIENDGHDDGTSDDDPFVVLIEVQCADGLPNEDNEEGPQHRVEGTAAATAQPSAADDRRSDDV